MTFIPVQRAVMKWPSSWRKIEMTTPTTNTKIQMLTNASQTNSPRIAAIARKPCHPPATSSSTVLGDGAARHDLALGPVEPRRRSERRRVGCRRSAAARRVRRSVGRSSGSHRHFRVDLMERSRWRSGARCDRHRSRRRRTWDSHHHGAPSPQRTRQGSHSIARFLSRTRSTATSLAALSQAGAVPPTRPAS